MRLARLIVIAWVAGVWVCTLCPCGGAPLEKIQAPQYAATRAVTLDVGKLIASGRVQPRNAISIDAAKDGHWILRTPKGPKALRWYRNLLNARPGAPDLTIDPGLSGTYDVYAQVRAVSLGGSLGMGAKPDDPFPMAFALELDDGSKSEVVGAKGFQEYHYDTEVLACYGWRLDGRKIVLRNLGKPVYLYALRFHPSKGTVGGATGKTVSRWLATDHVAIVSDPTKHFAFPGVARLQNGDLVVVYREGTVHGNEPIGKVSLSRSLDGGRTWLPRVTALDRPGRDDRDPTVFQMSDGTALLLSNSCLCTSRDSGKTWSAPLRTPVFGPNGAVEDEDGGIVYGGQERFMAQPITQIGTRKVYLNADSAHRSLDKGQSWQRVSVAAHTLYMPGPTDYVWYDEPFMCVVPGKFWVFALRVDLDGFARIVRSPDRGKTWGPIIQTPVWGYPQHLLPLKDGRLLMTYGYRRSPWGIRACLSSDNGKTWATDDEIILRMDAGTPEGQPRKVSDRDLGYPVSVQLPDGSVFTVYYMNKNGSNCFIAGTFWALPAKTGT